MIFSTYNGFTRTLLSHKLRSTCIFYRVLKWDSSAFGVLVEPPYLRTEYSSILKGGVGPSMQDMLRNCDACSASISPLPISR
jgi:hypothetical protein